jgi:hypothetical protein
MAFAPFFTLSLFVYLVLYQSFLTLIVALPILVLWGISPFIAWWVSRSFTRDKPQLSLTENLYLRKLARKIWAFFENFVREEDNWLPPDNYQMEPADKLRTGPLLLILALHC